MSTHPAAAARPRAVSGGHHGDKRKNPANSMNSLGFFGCGSLRPPGVVSNSAALALKGVISVAKAQSATQREGLSHFAPTRPEMRGFKQGLQVFCVAVVRPCQTGGGQSFQTTLEQLYIWPPDQPMTIGRSHRRLRGHQKHYDGSRFNPGRFGVVFGLAGFGGRSRKAGVRFVNPLDSSTPNRHQST